MPDENGMRTTRVPERTLNWWRLRLADHAEFARGAHPGDLPSDRSPQLDIIRSHALVLLLNATDHDDWERIAQDVAAVRQVLDGLDAS